MKSVTITDKTFKIDRLGFIIRAVSKHEITITRKAGTFGKKVNILHVPNSRRFIKKNDRSNIYWKLDVSAEYVMTVLYHYDDENFIALCEHFTGGKNYHDRG